MSIIRVVVLVGLCVLLAACSTGRYADRDELQASKQKLSDAEIGKRYLLGRGVQQNDEKAFYYFKRPMTMTHLHKMNSLTFMLPARARLVTM